MNSALKPVLASAGVPQPGGQSSPAKGNVASANHASVGLPQGAQNSLNHGANGSNLAVQNLTAHAPAPQAAPHDRAVPSMAPVTANMAQMAHNMSNHGNLSQGVPAAPPPTASPSKPPGPSTPLSLVADKVPQPTPSQPLALTRPSEKPEKKEPDSTAQSNGTIDSPKLAASAPVSLKPQNPEAKDKPDIAKTSPSTTKPPEKPQPTPLKPDSANQAPTPPAVPNVPTPKSAAVSELTDKSLKPAELKPTTTADVAPTQSDSKPAPESANSEPSAPEKEKEKEKPPTPAKLDPPAQPKPEPAKPEKKAEEKPCTDEKPNEPESKAPEAPKKDPLKVDVVDAPAKPVEKEKPEPKKVEPKKEKPKSTMKLATVTPPLRKRRQASPAKGDGPSPAKKASEVDITPDARAKRNRTKVQLYQSPTPELAMATKLSASAGRATPTKPNDDKLIVFYKNEYLAVRNAEGGFYVCQTMQNVYRTTRKIKIRWLSQDKQADPSGETYKPDFYDVTDMECVLTTLSLSRAAGGGGSQLLRATEQARATSILQRALRAESSPGHLQLTPEHPDGLDLSLYTDESQIEKRARKRAASKSSPRNKGDAHSDTAEETTPVKKARTVPKRSPKSAQKPKPTPPPPKPNNNKRKTAGSAPLVASTSKTATAVVEKGKPAPKVMPKRTPAKQAKKPEPPPVVTPLRKGRRSAAKDVKPSPAAQPSPSTSTGKAGRRKPPLRK